MVETEVFTRKNFFKFKTFYLQSNSCVIIKVHFFINCNSFLNYFNFLNIQKKINIFGVTGKPKPSGILKRKTIQKKKTEIEKNED